MSSKMKCPICGNEMTVKMDEKGVPTDMYACLKGCHCLLPESVVEEKKAIFPIIVLGTKDVGKSCYIGALLNELFKNREEVCFWKKTTEISTFDDEPTEGRKPVSLVQKYMNVFKNEHEKFRAVLESTRSIRDVANNDGMLNPLLVEMDFDDCDREILGMRASFRLGGHHFFKKKRTVLLCIIDIAGEDMDNNKNTLYNSFPILRYVKSIFMMIEPQQLAGVKSLIMEKIKNDRLALGLKEDVTGDETTIIDLLRAIRDGYAKISECPLAICVSKTDSLGFLFENQINDIPLFKSTSRRTKGCVDLSDLNTLNNFIQDELLIAGSRTRSPLEQLKGRFKYVCFFGVSSFGFNTMKDNGTSIGGDIISRRVLEPLLWALWQEGYLGGCE